TEKTSEVEVCPKCASPSRSVYDRRWVRVKDEPIRQRNVQLHIRKRRFMCKPCNKPFTEPVAGVAKGARTTARYRKAVLASCERFADLTSVQRYLRCSAGYLYKTLYAELERRLRMRTYPWPEVIGIDEHFFRRDRAFRAFVTVIVDMKGKRVFEVAEGKRGADIEAQLTHIPGRENVRWIALDLADAYKTFCKRFFPNAQLVADKFHVLRLLNPAINRARKAITGDRRSLPVRRWLLTSGKKLHREKRWRLLKWLNQHPELNQLYHAKESLHGFYRIRGYGRAKRALTKMCDALALSEVPELQTLRRTLIRWRREILNYFVRRLTNGRTEGFNAKAKLVKRRAYGFRSFRNYRLRLLTACT
ncbi:MAG: ISL3 family transposase, partial [Myxococcales bacterium]|nr:ISL3 family transposase [Myxococcales bacterium]